MDIQAVVIAQFVTLVVALIVQFVTVLQTNKTLRHQANQSKYERDFAANEAKRLEWKNYLIALMQQLITAREDYERFLGTDGTDQERHAAIVGRAIAVCLASDDDLLAKVATDSLTPYFVNDVGQSDWKTRNRNAIHEATRHLASMIKEA